MNAAHCYSDSACQWYGEDSSTGSCSFRADPCAPLTDALSCAYTQDSAGLSVCMWYTACQNECKSCK